MILQLVAIDKFADYVIRQFEPYNDVVKTILLESGVDVNLVKCRENTSIINPYSSVFDKLLTSLSAYESIIIHGLHWPWVEKVIKAKPSNTKVAWVFWGGEIYGRPDIHHQFLTSTSKFFTSLYSLKKRAKTKNSYFVPKDVFKEINYCLTDEVEEYEFAQDYTKANFNHLEYNYYTLEELLGNLYDCKCTGDNIFLGNAASVECNCWGSLFRLRLSNICNKKIIVPLSYGVPWVRNSVVNIGKFLFRSKLIPLIDFLPLQEYNKILLNCNVMIMPHIQPHAQGNIIVALWVGMRVFLSKKNLSYRYFKRLGCVVYSIEDDLGYNLSDFKCLTDEEITINRNILKSIYSKESTDKKVKIIIDKLLK